jgi:outer membrane protein assembly factor BamB
MPQRNSRIRGVARSIFLGAAVVAVCIAGGGRPAWAVIDNPAGSLSQQCKLADAIAVLRIEKVSREKKGIVYRKVRDLKGRFPNPRPIFGDTFTHILRQNPNPDWHRQDIANQDLQNDSVLAWAAEGKTAVIFQRGAEQVVCIGNAWYTLRSEPPANEHWVQSGGADSRFLRLFCGEAEELVAALADLLAGKEATVPRMVGTAKMLSEGVAPIRLMRADRTDPQQDFYSPFLGQAPWSTHRGNAQRTGADDGPGPKKPKVLWAHKSPDHFIAPLVPGAKDLFASNLAAFNTPCLRALALEPAGDKQVRWAKGAPLLRQPIAGAPVLLGGHTEMLVFGDGFHTSDGSSLRCVRASDGFPLWQLSVAGDLVHFEGTPTIANGKLYVGGGNAGVLCVEPGKVTLEGKEYDLPAVQATLENRWKELLAKYEVEKKKDPEFALPPDETMLPRPAPRRLWQQGQDRWHIDASVALVEDHVLATSAYLDDEKIGARELVCLKAGDGAVLWQTPLKLNPWAGPTVAPYVLVGCSSIRLDPKAIGGAKGEIVAVELDTGKVKWRKDVPGGVLSSVAVKAGMAIFTATDGQVRAWDAFTGQEKWAYDAKAPFFAGPAVAKNSVYAADLKGVVHAVNLADGKMMWTMDLGTDPATKMSGMVYGSPMVHRGRLYVATCNLGEKQARSQNAVVCIGEK